MTTLKILTPVLFAVATAAAGSAFAGGYNTYPDNPSGHSTLSRTQVLADLAHSAKDSTMEGFDAIYPPVSDSGRHETRAQVQHDMLASGHGAGAVPMQD